MAFVDQGAKQPEFSYFLAELDLSNNSYVASPSTLEKHKDANVQGLFATGALDCLSKSSNANHSTLQLASSSAIPHWMRSNQVQNIPIDTSIKSGSTRNMVASTSMPPGALSALPSPKLGFGSEGQTNSSIVIESTDGLVNSRHFSQQQVSAQPPLSVCSMSLLSLRRDAQKEEPKISKEDAFSFLLHKQEKQPAKERLVDLPILSLGLSSGQLSHERAEVSSWVSKFPFQIASTLGQAEHGQLTQCRENLGHNFLTNSRGEYLTEGACREVANIASMGSKGQTDHSKFLPEYSRSLTEVVLPQKTSLANASLNPAWPSAGSNAPSLKRDWNATLIQSVRHSQQIPDFFAQQKVAVAAKTNQSHFAKSEGTEKISKVAFSQKSLASRVNEENAGSNLASLHGTIRNDKSRNPLTDHKSIELQEMKNGREVLRTRTSLSQQSLHDSPRQVDLLKIKLETLTEDSKIVKGVKFASMKSIEKYDKFASAEGRVLIEAVPLTSGPAADQAARQLVSITSGIDGIVGTSRPAELMLFRDGASTELSTIVSAAPSIGRTAEIDGKFMLPFQQRFEQLQEFLKKCDGSDNEYCLRALCSLSKTAQSNQSAELESRALRLSVEEGKEIKRAKLLNVLDEIPEGACMDPHAKLMAPWFSGSRAVAVVKEEA